jgi:hypothetical protein
MKSAIFPLNIAPNIAPSVNIEPKIEYCTTSENRNEEKWNIT